MIVIISWLDVRQNEANNGEYVASALFFWQQKDVQGEIKLECIRETALMNGE